MFYLPSRKYFRLSCFTLLELLVVIAIIAILFSLLLPSLRHAKHLAMRVVCADQLKQIGMAQRIYLDDYDDIMHSIANGGNYGWPKLNAEYTRPWMADYRSYFPDIIRWCPTLEPYCRPPLGSMTWAPRTDYTVRGASGYVFPMQDNQYGYRYMISRRRAPNSNYISLKPGVVLGEIGDPPYVYPFYGITWNVMYAFPMAADMLFRYSTTRFAYAHSFGRAKATTSPGTTGANSAWEDGHVEWTNWKKHVNTMKRASRPAVTIWADSGKPGQVVPTHISGSNARGSKRSRGSVFRARQSQSTVADSGYTTIL